MHDILIILKTDLLSFKNRFTVGNVRKRISTIGGVLIFLVFAGFIGSFAYKMTNMAQDAFSQYPGLIHTIEVNLLSATSLAIFILLFMTGIKVIYDNFYESGDLGFLLATPLKTESVFMSKFLKSFGTNLITLLPFNGAIWIGFGIAVGAGWGFYPMVFLTIIMATAIFTAALSIIVMLIARFIPSQRMKQIMMVGSLAISLIFVIAIQYYNSMNIGNQGAGIDSQQLLETVGKWGLDKTGYLPHIWIVKSILLFVKGFSYNAFESVLPLVLSTGVAVYAAVRLAKHTFLTGWSSSQESDTSSKKKTSARRKPSIDDRAVSGKGGVIRGNLRKDLVTFVRTPMMWYSILVILVVMGFMVFNISHQTGGQISPGEAKFMRVMFLFIVMLVSASASSRSGSVSISLEGKTWWLMKQAPVKPSDLYISKLLYGMISTVVVSIVVVVGMTLYEGVPVYPLYVSLPVVIFTGTVIAAVSLVLDILYPNFEISNSMEGTFGKQKNAGMGKQMVSILISMIAVFLLAALFSFPLYYSYIGIVSGLSEAAATVISYAVFGGAALILNFICYKIGTKHLHMIFTGAPQE